METATFFSDNAQQIDAVDNQKISAYIHILLRAKYIYLLYTLSKHSIKIHSLVHTL